LAAQSGAMPRAGEAWPLATAQIGDATNVAPTSALNNNRIEIPTP